MGVGFGLLICLIVGAGMIGAFYALGKDQYAVTEDIWEGTFALIAALIISLMGAALLRVSKLQDKWRVKLAKALESKSTTNTFLSNTLGARFKRWCEKYAMFVLPFVTVLREGLEAVVFIGGVGLTEPATSFPLAVISGLATGIFVGYLIYRYAILPLDSGQPNLTNIQWWQHGFAADFPHRIHLFPLPRCSRPLLKRHLVIPRSCRE